MGGQFVLELGEFSADGGAAGEVQMTRAGGGFVGMRGGMRVGR